MSTADYKILPNLYKRLFLRPLGLNTDNSMVLWLLLLSGGVMLGGLWYFQGHLPVVLAIFYFSGIFILSFLRLDYSFYVLVFSVLILDQFAIPGFNPLSYQIDFFSSLKEISYLPFFEAGILNPIEIHLFFIILSLFFLISIKKDFEWRPIPVAVPFFLFFTCFLIAFYNGLRGGADFNLALWEVRALIYFFLLYMIVPQIIRTRSQIHILVWIFIICFSYKAFQAAGRFIELEFTTGALQALTNPEDPVFFVTMLLLLFGLLMFNVRNQQRFWLFVFFVPLLLGLYLAIKTAAYASLVISLVIFLILLPTSQILKFFKYFSLVLITMGIYTAVYWNNSGPMGKPVQMIKSGIVMPSKEIELEDYFSPYPYHDFENYNLAKASKNYPILGTGFGNKYDQSLAMVPLSFQLSDYIPHNGIFWVLVKMGSIGFFAFWFFFNAFTAKGVKLLYRITNPYLKVILLVVLTAVINQLVVSFFDFQFSYYRNMIYLGCLMGFLPAVEAFINSEEENSEKSKALANVGR